MAGSLPDKLIVKIAEHLVEQVGPRESLYVCRNHAESNALFSPVLLDEYIKILLDTKVFYFSTSAYLYAFINAPGISEAALQRRRSIRSLHISRWGDCDCQDCWHWPGFPLALSNHGYDSSLGPAIRLMPRVTKVHVKYPMSRVCDAHEAKSRILTALQPVLMRSHDLSTVLFHGYFYFVKLGCRDSEVEREDTRFKLSLFEWAKNCGLLDMVDMDETWTYTDGEPNPCDVLRQVWEENDNGRRTEPPDALLRHWNETVAEKASRFRTPIV
ncbi:hypothetical protein HDK77DRAFT_510881 [Phyllosticta capitalensis]